MNVPGTDADLNVALERANRVADYMEFGELLALDALTREESCGGHFRTEHQTADGEAQPRRCAVLPRRRVGVRGRGQAARAARGAARVREREARGAELQVREWLKTPSLERRPPRPPTFGGRELAALVSKSRQQGCQGCQLLGVGSWQPCWSETVQQGCQVGSVTRVPPTIEARFRLGFPAFRYGGG